MADTRDELIKLTERDSLLGINYYYKGIAICEVRTERNLN
jgi:hypothetical protein